MKIAIAQLNLTVGALQSNGNKIFSAWEKTRQEGADLLVTPELSISGYPLDDLALRPAFIADVRRAVEGLAQKTKTGPALLVGAPWEQAGQVFNAALLLENGVIQDVIFKRALPQYGPFDEKRIFASGPSMHVVRCKQRQLGILICEDLWMEGYAGDLNILGAEILIAMNASPFDMDKEDQRLKVAHHAVREAKIPLIYVNQTGGNDELLFDGASFALNGENDIVMRLPEWQEQISFLDFLPEDLQNGGIVPGLPFIESLYTGLVLSIRDYAHKNGFTAAVIGLSSGIDSALTAALAADALGPENVQTLMLPSAITSDTSRHDAAEAAANIGCGYTEAIGIDAPLTALKGELMKFWGHEPHNPFTFQNVQARLRMLALFAVSNENGCLVLNTSNKSEAAMGHSTFYGDTSGGFAPLVDIFKTNVYALAHWRNAHRCVIGRGRSGTLIPLNILEKPPSPELSPGETDSDHLPPYPVLDAILERLIERNQSIREIINAGFESETVRLVVDKMNYNEFKRHQMPPGPRVTRLSFARRERRYPVTNGYRES